jgi:hypothetical protein
LALAAASRENSPASTAPSNGTIGAPDCHSLSLSSLATLSFPAVTIPRFPRFDFDIERFA